MAQEKLRFEYDENSDILTIEGVKYSGGLFRSLTFIPLERPFKIIKREDGLLTISEAV